ncbi:MAG: PAS domain S-box protein [Rhodoferax sp.]|nr:MAG: PAS domain S-box protein [Rhodoferax sp.]
MTPNAHSEVPEQARTGLLHHIAVLWPVWVCLGLSLLGGSVLQNAHHARSVVTQQQQLELQARAMRDRLQAEAARAFSPTAGLATLIHVDGTLSRERFERLIERSLTLVPFIRSVVAAPDDVARYVYPLAGNERVFNLDYRNVPAQWQQVQQAKKQKAPLLFAPVRLVQGGLAVIQRTPVFVADTYWGVLSVVADLDRFMTSAGMGENEQLEVALFAESGELIWGQWPETGMAGSSVPVNLPGAQWILRVRPQAGWSSAGLAPEAVAVWAGGSIMAILIALLVGQTQSLRRGNRALFDEMAHSREIQSALERSQAESLAMRDRLQAVLDAATEVAIIATDLDGNVTVFNRGAERMLGYDVQEVLGHSPAIWHVAEEISTVARTLRQPSEPLLEGFAVFAHLAQAQGTKPQAWTYMTRAGKRVPVSLALSTLRTPEGESMGYLGVARDLSAQRKAEADLHLLAEDLENRVNERTRELRTTMQTLQQTQEGLARAEKLAALGSLVAGVAHELNTPIGNCLVTASTLQEHTQDIHQAVASGSMRKSAFDAYLRDVDQGVDILLRGLSSAAELVQHFKQLSVDQASEQRRSFVLSSVVDDVVSLSRASWKSTPYQVGTAIALPKALDSYPGALGRVLTNLLQNALLHGFEGRSSGLLQISASELDEQTIELRIEDNGIGMRDEVRRRAFDPFFTTKLGQGGSGLGLNIVYNTVTGVLGGSIELHSTPGVGTQFILRIPYHAPSRGVAPSA